jgi:DNA-binding transcriptional regulator GbsR (MarR family)
MVRKIWKIVLKCVWRSRDPIKITEISKETDLKDTQVYRAIHRLNGWGLVKVIREGTEDIGYKKPPKGNISIITNQNQLRRIKKLVK